MYEIYRSSEFPTILSAVPLQYFCLALFLRLAIKIHFQLLSWQWMETPSVGIAFVPIVVGDGTNVLQQQRSSKKFLS